MRRWARLKAVPPLDTKRNGFTSAALRAASALTTYLALERLSSFVLVRRFLPAK
jgi:hypothetical protein